MRLQGHFPEIMKDLHRYIEFRKTNPPDVMYVNDVDWESVRAELQSIREQTEQFYQNHPRKDYRKRTSESGLCVRSGLWPERIWRRRENNCANARIRV